MTQHHNRLNTELKNIKKNILKRSLSNAINSKNEIAYLLKKEDFSKDYTWLEKKILPRLSTTKNTGALGLLKRFWWRINR